MTLPTLPPIEIRHCRRCDKDLPVTAFKPTKKVHRIGTCIACKKEQQKQWAHDNPDKVKAKKQRYRENNRERYLEMERGYSQKRREYILKWNRDNYVYAQNRLSNLKKWGEDGAEYYEKAFEKQGGVCAICKNPQDPPEKALCIDHNHATGEKRGLLCIRCNFFIGNAKENVSILQSGIDYLREWATRNYPPNLSTKL